MIYSFPPYESPNKYPFAWWENFLTEDEINLILSAPEWNDLIQARIGINPNTNMPTDVGVRASTNMPSGVVDSGVRETQIAWYTRTHENNHIWDKLSLAAREANRNFFKFDLTGFYEPAQLGYYSGDRKSHYTWHIDAGISDSKPPRKLSMVLQLNDPSEFEGGQLQVKATTDEPTTLELKRGRAWFFPSYVLHRVTPVTRGTRKSLVLWITGPEFK